MAAGLPKSEFGCTLRFGVVSSVNATKHRAKVKFSEIDGLVTRDLPVLVPFGGDYVLPAAETPVVCLLSDGEQGFGVILGAFYTDNDTPPLDDKGKRAIDGADIRIGDPAATDKAAKAPPTNDNFAALWGVLNSVFGAESSPLVTPAPSAPDPVYAAMKAAIAAKVLAGDLPPADVAAENVSIK